MLLVKCKACGEFATCRGGYDPDTGSIEMLSDPDFDDEACPHEDFELVEEFDPFIDA